MYQIETKPHRTRPHFHTTPWSGGVRCGEGGLHGDIDAHDANSKRADYQRAQTACLEGRGYTVK